MSTSDMNLKREKSEMEFPCFIASLNDDLLNNILSRLPANSFAFASCVCRSWNIICCQILSHPIIRSAFVSGLDIFKAAEEVLDKVLSKPIRPDFVIANVTSDVRQIEISRLIVERVGSRIPVIVSLVPGFLGKEACSNDIRELKWEDPINIDTSIVSDGKGAAILLTIGYMPGLKVEVIPVVKEDKELEETMGNKFVMDIRKYVSSVSDRTAPICVMLFGGESNDVELIFEKLDYAMPEDTLFMGAECSQCVYKMASEPRNAWLNKSSFGRDTVLTGLVFATDRHKSPNVGELRFHAMISRGISQVGPMYKAASVSGINAGSHTILTGKREGRLEILDGHQLCDQINDLLGNHAEDAYLYIGVTKRRNCSVGSKKPKRITSIVYHEITGGDEHGLIVEGTGIKTGDYFQFYYTDVEAAQASVSEVSSQIKDLKTKLDGSVDRKTEFVGGFIFTCFGRGESFFGRPNIDSSPFLENLPELPFGGIFCEGEVFRLPREEENEHREGSVCRCLHVYSAIYLLVTYAPPLSSSSSS